MASTHQIPGPIFFKHLVHAVLLLPSALPVHPIVQRVSARAGFGGSWPRFFFFPSRRQHSEAAGVEERRARDPGFCEEAETARETVPGSHADTVNTQTRSSSKNIQFVLMISTKKQKQNLRLKLLIGTLRWGRRACGQDAEHGFTKKTKTNHHWSWTRWHLHLQLPCIRLLFDVAFDQCKGWHTDVLRATLPYVNIWRNHNEMSEKKMTGNGKTVVWHAGCTLMEDELLWRQRKKCASLGLTWEA